LSGSSYVSVYVKLTDEATQKVVNEKVLTINNGVFVAVWELGSEQSLPKDMGQIVGEYIVTISSN